jgi:hypothetical protein
MLLEWAGIELTSEFTCPGVVAQPLCFVLTLMRNVEERSHLFGGSIVQGYGRETDSHH